MGITILPARKALHSAQIQAIFWEYLQWANARINEEYRVDFDIEAILAGELQNLDKYLPPKGSLLLAFVQEQLAGIACLKPLAPGIGEIKRVYVRPEYRRRGIARALIDQLMVEAATLGYERVRLDSAGFMQEAHRLYRAKGFRDIQAYEGSEIPKEFQHHWVFMELDLEQEVIARQR
jgi:ribosomal protein S18 acetylase RimI-like enzyme